MGARTSLRFGFPSRRITTATTTAVKGSTGAVVRVVVEAATTGTVTINDSAGTLLILAATTPIGSYELNIACAGKIEVITSAADRVVVVYE